MDGSDGRKSRIDIPLSRDPIPSDPILSGCKPINSARWNHNDSVYKEPGTPELLVCIDKLFCSQKWTGFHTKMKKLVWITYSIPEIGHCRFWGSFLLLAYQSSEPKKNNKNTSDDKQTEELRNMMNWLNNIIKLSFCGVVHTCGINRQKYNTVWRWWHKKTQNITVTLKTNQSRT